MTTAYLSLGGEGMKAEFAAEGLPYGFYYIPKSKQRVRDYMPEKLAVKRIVFDPDYKPFQVNPRKKQRGRVRRLKSMKGMPFY